MNENRSPHKRHMIFARWLRCSGWLWLGLFVSTGAAWADVGPIRYYERCTEKQQKKAGEECVWCSTFFRDITQCRKKWQARGYRFRCKRGGASVWREYWCRQKKQQFTPAQRRVVRAARRVFRAARQNNPRLLKALCSAKARPGAAVQQLCQLTSRKPQWKAFSQKLKHGKLQGAPSLKGTVATVRYRWDQRHQRTGFMRFILRKQRWYLTAITRW